MVATGRGRYALETARRVVPHRGFVHPDQIDGLAASVSTTLETCLRRLPFDEARAVADSALRHDV